jgi:predicted glycoside hydrolase/deacetylase ChbG (UPF0249 family)
MASGFVLCADDFALTDGVSRSILALLEAGRLSAAALNIDERRAWICSMVASSRLSRVGKW